MATAFEPECKRTILFQTELFEIVAIDWNRARLSEMHNHGWSQCMVLVQEGTFENTLELGFKTEVQALEVGQVVNTPVGAKHKMRCLSVSGKTLHVYIPRIHETSEAGQFKAPDLGALASELKLDSAVRIDQLRSIMNQIQEKSVSTHSPYFMNQLFAGILPQMLMAEDLILRTKTTLATNEASPVFSKIEEEVVVALGRLIGWPEDERHGLSVPGGSAANFMALHCARQKAFPEAKAQGHGPAKFRVYVSAEAHYSMKKACVVLGMGTDALVKIASDAHGKLRCDELKSAIARDKAAGFTPLMVCATAGTTVLGAFDPIAAMAEICATEKIWLHVDAAWGGPALFSKQLRARMAGVDRADSLTFDAHKLFGANLTSSFFLTRHAKILFEANDVAGGDYIFHDDGFDRGRLSWQCGRRAEATSWWAIWKSVGTEGLGEFVDRQIQIREQMLTLIEQQPRLRLVGEPEFLNVCVRVLPPAGDDRDWSKVVRAALINDNSAMVNYSSNADGPFLRFILAHPYLEFHHVREILMKALAIDGHARL